MSKALVLRRGVGAESLAEVDNSLPQIFNLALWNFIHMDLVMEIGRNTDPESQIVSTGAAMGHEFTANFLENLRLNGTLRKEVL